MDVPFSDHVALLTHHLHRRAVIVDTIEGTLLNVRGKETSRIRDRRFFEQRVNACFYGAPGLSRDLAKLKGELAARHIADGFDPVLLDRYTHELDPLELIVRAYEYWDRHRWPGSSGRKSYAESVYTVFVLRQLELLTSRIWDDGVERAEEHLSDIQRLLDALNGSPTSTTFVRDARWLIQTAQGPLTRQLRPYFTVAEQIAGSFTDRTRIGIHKAGARLAGGHLRSQLRYRSWTTGRPLDDPENLAITRNSNSMDSALLVRDLVALLGAYEQAQHDDDPAERLDLADAIVQGLSADPELFLTRLDLLAPCTMIEELFVSCSDNGQPRYTSLGASHVGLLEQYRELIGRLAAPLMDDTAACDPAGSAYSPLGIAYGFCADILANMAADTLVSQPALGLSLEDMFVSRGALDAKLARAIGWHALPRREGEREHFDHSLPFATATFAQVMGALEARAARPSILNGSPAPDARLFVVPQSGASHVSPDDSRPEGIVLADDYLLTTDMARALSGGAVARSENEMLTDRQEGRFLASGQTDGVWMGVSKILLTFVTSKGRDALITGVPDGIVDVLRLTCPGLVVAED